MTLSIKYRCFDRFWPDSVRSCQVEVHRFSDVRQRHWREALGLHGPEADVLTVNLTCLGCVALGSNFKWFKCLQMAVDYSVSAHLWKLLCVQGCEFSIIFLLSSAFLEFCWSQVIWLIDGLVDVPSIPTLFRFILGTIGDGDIIWNWPLNIAEHRWARMDAVERFRYWTQSLLLLEDLRAAERPASRPNAVSYSCLELKSKCWPWPISSPTGCINWL